MDNINSKEFIIWLKANQYKYKESMSLKIEYDNNQMDIKIE